VTLEELRAAIVQTIHDVVSPSGVRVEAHGGSVDETEIRRWGARAPCIFVSLLGISKFNFMGGNWNGVLQWAIFVVTKDEPNIPRDIKGLRLMTIVSNLVRPDGDRWGDTNSGPPIDCWGQNIYSGKVDQMGLCLWQLSWRQEHEIEAFDVSALNDFVTYQTEYEVGDDDTDNPTDTITLEQD
jgi:hypothetical protein